MIRALRAAEPLRSQLLGGSEFETILEGTRLAFLGLGGVWAAWAAWTR